MTTANYDSREAPTSQDLETTLKIFQNAILGDAHEFEITKLDRLGIPLWGAFVWTQDGGFNDGFGYGVDSLAARVSAWGEVMECYHAAKFLKTSPRKRSSYNKLRDENAINPISLCLDAGGNYSHDKEIIWTKAKRHANGQDVWLPLEAVAIATNDVSAEISLDEKLFLPITNGLGAGSTLEQALTHGVLELIQRDGDCVTFRAFDAGCKIELDDVKNEETRNLLKFLEDSNIEITAKLANVVCGVPVIYVVGHDRNLNDAEFPLTLSACGEAAHPDREKCFAKALREFVSSRARKRFMHGSIDDIKRVAPTTYSNRILSDKNRSYESRSVNSILEWTNLSNQEFFDIFKTPIFDVKSTVKFSELPTIAPDAGNDAKFLLNLLKTRLEAENMEILYADFTPQNADFAAVRAIVPGLEGETVSYNRIGRRNFERLSKRAENEPNLRGIVGTGEKPESALKIHLTEQDERLIGGEAWINPIEIERIVGKLYGLYREPNGHTIAKIKAQQ
ncbi:MAG: YcaO-like family protein [Pyrinomonadaceae bacterium]|nr:YcaO-like family protein [Pyrinomonadaceae bacterium]